MRPHPLILTVLWCIAFYIAMFDLVVGIVSL